VDLIEAVLAARGVETGLTADFVVVEVVACLGSGAMDTSWVAADVEMREEEDADDKTGTACSGTLNSSPEIRTNALRTPTGRSIWAS
jgi:hypothetical protein